MRNIGPKSSRELSEIGIKTRDQLRALGVEETTRRLLFRFGSEKKISLNYLYALEGAIHGHDWRDITPARKQELKALLDTLRRELSGDQARQFTGNR
ncbi:TfoX/Sxy family DNA transformation protein [Thalassospira sp. ER-Se-21-Dark]|uniref:TfoX/Sxy family DNA transformation protein n=1 Tax=Thalassospira sp. ER-Se-21-Dark TaxID=2585190 RepID=UPI001B30AD8F|nr:TfoX/Sxy family DNA transformation protein [Thalassospira sp. ER-Se-21-Dark]MBP3127398.1 transcriptional regulator [Thalassospira sp. ER-Se-21-Dark]